MERLNKTMRLGDLLFRELKVRNLLKSEGLGIAVSGLEYTLLALSPILCKLYSGSSFSRVLKFDSVFKDN